MKLILDFIKTQYWPLILYVYVIGTAVINSSLGDVICTSIKSFKEILFSMIKNEIVSFACCLIIDKEENETAANIFEVYFPDIAFDRPAHCLIQLTCTDVSTFRKLENKWEQHDHYFQWIKQYLRKHLETLRGQRTSSETVLECLPFRAFFPSELALKLKCSQSRCEHVRG